MDYLTVAGFAIGLVGIGIAVIAWFRPRTGRRRLTWTVASESVLVDPDTHAIPKLQVTVAGQEMRSLAVTVLRAWNGGTDAIRRADLRQVRLKLEEGVPVLAWLSAVTSKSNDISVTASAEADYAITFDYLNRGDGFEITVVHPRTSEGPRIVGSLVGADLEASFSMGPVRGRETMGQWAVLLLFWLGIVGVLAGMLQFQSSDVMKMPEVQAEIRRISTSPYTLTMLGLGFLMWATGFFTLVAARMQREAEPEAKRFVRMSPDA